MMKINLNKNHLLTVTYGSKRKQEKSINKLIILYQRLYIDVTSVCGIGKFVWEFKIHLNQQDSYLKK
jgi:hypothetical protein